MSAVTVIGAGAVGLTLAGRLAQHGVPVEIFEANEATQRVGSRAICMQRETLEIWARLGAGEAIARRGVQWRIGRTYFRGRELFNIELPEASDDHFPPFVNINQSEVEDVLAERAAALGARIHHRHRFIGLEQDTGSVTATFATERGEVAHRSSFLVGTDGAHSTVRHAIGMGFPGHTFDDRFLIADIRAELPFTNERHFHFDPPWNPSRQVLIHPQPDGVWRIDWQVPSETDEASERASGRLDRRIHDVIGTHIPYELVWMTGYRFSQRLADAFRAGCVFLAGDAAHVMAPFGARGLNSGIADAENLAWKLAWALGGGASDALLDTYDAERRPVAFDNLAVTNATMRFLAPHGPVRRAWRDLVLRMAPRSSWFRRRVNSGRLAEPAVYAPSSIISPGHGWVAPDVRLADGNRLRDLLGRGYVAVSTRPLELPAGISSVAIGPASVYGDERAWVVRPDGYVAESVSLDLPASEVAAEVARAIGFPASGSAVDNSARRS